MATVIQQISRKNQESARRREQSKKIEDLEKKLAGGTSTFKTQEEKDRDVLKEDIKAGKDLLGKDFQEGKLGRISEERSDDVKDIIARRREGLEGLSAEENQALRDRGKQGIQRGVQSSLRQLRGVQGASGVRGGTAGSQQANVLKAGQQAEANVERDLFIKNVDVKRQALSGFESSILGAEEQERSGELFNIGQRGKEIAGTQAAGLGFAALSSTERGNKAALEVAQANARSAGGGGKK